MSLKGINIFGKISSLVFKDKPNPSSASDIDEKIYAALWTYINGFEEILKETNINRLNKILLLEEILAYLFFSTDLSLYEKLPSERERIMLFLHQKLINKEKLEFINNRLIIYGLTIQNKITARGTWIIDTGLRDKFPDTYIVLGDFLDYILKNNVSLDNYNGLFFHLDDLLTTATSTNIIINLLPMFAKFHKSLSSLLKPKRKFFNWRF